MPSIAPQLHEIGTDETRAIAVDMEGKLDDTTSPEEKLTGTPTITEVSTTDLTLGSKAVSTTSLTINGTTVITGRAIQFTCDATSATKGKTYTIKIVCGTDASQTVSGSVKVKII